MSGDNIRICDVTQTYREQLNIAQEEFANLLTKELVNIKVSRQAVSNWEKGENYPSTDFLLLCSVIYEDWRQAWAMDCLKVKLPEVFDPNVVSFKLAKPK